ncbi:hypothetical protein G6F37_001999 [Rhizopus arrhizus]|nr:hypothetical protein G6F38_002179 [Rhizopus arrhizus]KAG1162609.1 hypothetical protein G6F37_001999 [Rhizopus arrhizus]
MLSRNKYGIQKCFYSTKTFQQLGISTPTCQNLKINFNITQPTFAQQELIPALLQGNRDILLRDATGTGKSFGIALTLASLITPNSQSVRSLYIAPNQELASQIGTWMQQLTPHSNQIRVMAGPDTTQVHASHTVIGTPGRILESIGQGELPVQTLDRLIVDEVDQALSLPRRHAPLREQRMRAKHPKPAELLLDKLQQFKSRHQTILTSATFNRPLRFFLNKRGYVHDPVFLDLNKNSTIDHTAVVKHHCLLISDDKIRNMQENKLMIREQEKKTLAFDDTDERMIESVATLQEIESVHNGILFVSPSISIEAIKEQLAEYQVSAEDIKNYSADHAQNVLWIATEFTARGIDIPDVSHVFILGRPSSTAAYLHMAGRTGRLSPNGFRPGKVINLVRDHEWTESKMKNMYELLNIPVEDYEYVE